MDMTSFAALATLLLSAFSMVGAAVWVVASMRSTIRSLEGTIADLRTTITDMKTSIRGVYKEMDEHGERISRLEGAHQASG